MKTLKYLYVILLSLSLFSCSSDDDTTSNIPLEETTGFLKIQELSNETHIVELFSEKGFLTQGYNQITLRIKDKKNETYITDAVIDWMPIMHMSTMQHSCPKSPVVKQTGKQPLYGGEIVFHMPQNETEFWELVLTYTINNNTYTVADTIKVSAAEKRNVNSFIGKDGSRYIVAYISPKDPKIGLNSMSVGVYKMQDMMTFPVVDNFKLKIDPRMPAMGNHGSPNNTDLLQGTPGRSYDGKLSLTMTGYWKINLQLFDASDKLQKGEAVTAENPESSLFFETEF